MSGRFSRCTKSAVVQGSCVSVRSQNTIKIEELEKTVSELKANYAALAKRLAIVECAPPSIMGGVEFQQAFREDFGTNYDPENIDIPVIHTASLQ